MLAMLPAPLAPPPLEVELELPPVLLPEVLLPAAVLLPAVLLEAAETAPKMVKATTENCIFQIGYPLPRCGRGLLYIAN